jgi:hypothetical protein
MARKPPTQKLDPNKHDVVSEFATRLGIPFWDARAIIIMYGPYRTICTAAAHKYKRRLARLEAGRQVR